MDREYSFTLTVPLEDFDEASAILNEAKKNYSNMRISRKTDRAGCARIYLSFPFSSARPDIKFQQWFMEQSKSGWDLFDPTHGRWGLS